MEGLGFPEPDSAAALSLNRTVQGTLVIMLGGGSHSSRHPLGLVASKEEKACRSNPSVTAPRVLCPFQSSHLLRDVHGGDDSVQKLLMWAVVRSVAEGSDSEDLDPSTTMEVEMRLDILLSKFVHMKHTKLGRLSGGEAGYEGDGN